MLYAKVSRPDTRIMVAFFDSHQITIHLQLLVSVCTPPLVRTECLCERTCDNLDSVVCPVWPHPDCVRGCQCPFGQVLQDGKCIPQASCPCVYEGKSYAVSIIFVWSIIVRQIVVVFYTLLLKFSLIEL